MFPELLPTRTRTGTKQCVIVTRNEEKNFFLAMCFPISSYSCFPVCRQLLSTFRRLETPNTRPRSFVLAVDQLVGHRRSTGWVWQNTWKHISAPIIAWAEQTTASEMKAWFNGFPMATGFVRSEFWTIFHASVGDVGTWNRRWMANTTPTGMPKEVIS